MNSPILPDIHTRDQIAQGRILLLGIAAGYYILWVLGFVTNPVLLVPGFALDGSLHTAGVLLGLLLQFAFFSLCLLLVWAGIGWMRYVLAVYLLTSGLITVIMSINLGGFGGALLILGAVELASAAALALSISILRFIEDRRRRGVPWAGLAFAFLGLGFIPAAVAGFDVADAAFIYQTERHAYDFATGIFHLFAPGLDTRVLADSAGGRLKDSLGTADFDAQFADLRNDLGPMSSLDLPRRPNLARVILDPVPGPARSFNATAHYAHGDAILSIEVDTSGPEPLITDLYVQETARTPPKKGAKAGR